MNSVGVRELQQNLSKYLTQVKEGKSFVVTERGTSCGRSDCNPTTRISRYSAYVKLVLREPLEDAVLDEAMSLEPAVFPVVQPGSG